MKHSYEDLSMFIKQLSEVANDYLNEDGQEMLKQILNIVTIAYEEGEID